MRDKKLLAKTIESYLNKVNSNFVVKKYSLKQVLIMVTLIILAGIVLSTHGCFSGDYSPMGSLASEKVSDKFGYGFWWDEAKKDSSLWKKAATYCTTPENSHNVNCAKVNEINLLINISTAAPTYNSNTKGFGAIPDFTN